MISFQQKQDSVSKLEMLKYFPTKPAVVAQVGMMLDDICRTDEEAVKLTAAVLDKFSEWPGPGKVKEIYQAEIASQRPREEQMYCPKCNPHMPVAGWRSGFEVWAAGEYPGGSAERIFPESYQQYFKTREELQKRSQASGVTITELSTFCTCPAGERLADAETRRRNG